MRGLSGARLAACSDMTLGQPIDKPLAVPDPAASSWRYASLALARHDLAWKQRILRSPLGELAGNVRDGWTFLRCAYAQPELLGMVANDQMATSIAVRLCRPGKVFVDVGAHIGSVLDRVLRHCSGARVVAIEADPRKAAALAARYPDIVVHAAAAGPCAGEASFFVHPTLSAYSSLGRPARGTREELCELRVPVRALDDLLVEGVDVLKIDVEGAELGVLLGAERLVATSRPAIMFESGPPHDDGLGYTKPALWKWLADRDYGIYIPNRVAHLGQSLSLSGFLESHLHPRRTTNYFALPAEKRDVLRECARTIAGC
jgi:FkbM family methyltransferase